MAIIKLYDPGMWPKQVLSPDYGNREWDSEEEDGFDPYWGVLPEAPMQEGDLRGDAAFLVRQLAPLLGHHAPKCGLLCTLAEASGIPIHSVTRPGEKIHRAQKGF